MTEAGYEVIQADTLGVLTNRVAKRIVEGWLPAGGPFYNDKIGWCCWMQAIYRSKT